MNFNNKYNNVNIPEKLVSWNAKTYVKDAKDIARNLAGISTDLNTQLRKIFDTLRKKQFEFKAGKQTFSKDEIYILKPRLAYTVARNYKLKPVFDYLDKVIDKIGSEDDFDKVVKFMESIIAYYKFYKGRKQK